MTPAEIKSVTRTIRDLARAYLQANIIGEEIADRFWGHCEIDTMVDEYIDSHTRPADIECTHCGFRYRDNDTTGLCDPCDWKINLTNP